MAAYQWGDYTTKLENESPAEWEKRIDDEIADCITYKGGRYWGE